MSFGQPDIHNTIGIGLWIPEITENIKEGGPLVSEGLVCCMKIGGLRVRTAWSKRPTKDGTMERNEAQEPGA